MPGSAPQQAPQPAKARPRVGLFVTCLVDLFRPSVGFAAVKLLTDAGCEVDVPTLQTCCGQPAYNSGDKATARQLARQTIAAFEAHDYVVAPSGSCAGMLKRHYPELLKDDPAWKARATAFAAKVHELLSFLVDVRGVSAVDASLEARATYHDAIGRQAHEFRRFVSEFAGDLLGFVTRCEQTGIELQLRKHRPRRGSE